MALTGKQKRFLRGLGHGLTPIVQVGKEGISDGIASAVDQALEDHELIKLRVGQNATVGRKQVAEDLAARTNSSVAQILGSTILLYRTHPKEPTIKLPKAAAESAPAAEAPAPAAEAEAPAAAAAAAAEAPAPAAEASVAEAPAAEAPAAEAPAAEASVDAELDASADE